MWPARPAACWVACSAAPKNSSTCLRQQCFLFRTYAVGVLSLRQPLIGFGNRSSSSFCCVRFSRAPRGKTAHKRMDKYHAAVRPEAPLSLSKGEVEGQAKSAALRCQTTQLRNSYFFRTAGRKGIHQKSKSVRFTYGCDHTARRLRSAMAD